MKFIDLYAELRTKFEKHLNVFVIFHCLLFSLDWSQRRCITSFFELQVNAKIVLFMNQENGPADPHNSGALTVPKSWRIHGLAAGAES